MTPRPRTVSDGEILEGAVRVISRIGPGRLTLARVGAEVGLSAATLVQRFGSKRGLLLAIVESAVGSVERRFAAAAAAHGSPLEALLAAAVEMTRYVATPEELAHHLAFLQLDLGDPDFHRLALEHARRTLAGYRGLLDAAVAAGELARCDTAALAHAIDAVAGGSLINWAIHRKGPAEAWVRRDLATLLAPYRRGAAPPLNGSTPSPPVPPRPDGRRRRPPAPPG
ncbi:MAG TPA: helix-turn-helix domain-containing protein [Gemmatimonadales bacterium]|nr:helix-turn-helix domain-containing protein [Gemmatimonadales bacterium]